MAESVASTSSTLSRTLSNCLQLPNLSPLTDRAKVKPTPGMENVAQGLLDSGFDVGWDNGKFQVSTPTPPQPGVLSVTDILMGKGPERVGSRQRTPSFLTFSTYKTGSPAGTQQRPKTSGSMDLRSSMPGPVPKPPSPSGRFARLNQSLDNINQLHLHSSAPHIPKGNLAALSEPRFGAFLRSPSGSRPMTAPVPAGATEVQQDSMANGAESPRPGTSAVHVAGRPTTSPAGPGTGAGAGASTSPAADQEARPGTAASVQRLDLSALDSLQRPSTSQARPVTGPRHGANSVARPSPFTTKRSHPMSSWRPTRGHALVVFNDMDRDKNGKVTRAELEDAALALGFTLEQAHRLFERLDDRKRGYVEAMDWGRKDFSKVVESFTFMYMQKFLGLPDSTATAEQVNKYWKTQETRMVKSLPAAINLVRVNTVTRGAHASSGSGNAVYDAFRFIDTDNSGDLSKEELRDAFYALGVYIHDHVADQIMDVFDQDGNGSVNYFEFLRAMFPGASKSIK